MQKIAFSTLELIRKTKKEAINGRSVDVDSLACSYSISKWKSTGEWIEDKNTISGEERGNRTKRRVREASSFCLIKSAL
jgi:hypothetical protein